MVLKVSVVMVVSVSVSVFGRNFVSGLFDEARRLFRVCLETFDGGLVVSEGVREREVSWFVSRNL